jgi:hypothetical protein
MATRKQRSAARRTLRRAKRIVRSKLTLRRQGRRVRRALGRKVSAVKRRRVR